MWLVVLCSSATAQAANGSVQVNLNQMGMELADAIGTNVAELTANAEQKIDALFELSALPQLLRSLANTGAFANRGLGVDYQPDPGDVIVGVVASGAMASDAGLRSDRPLSATVINYALVGGVNLGRWHHPRWTVFANGSYAAATIRGLSGELVSAGSHVHYALVPAAPPRALRWYGVGITTGLEYARWSLGLDSSLQTNIVVTGSTDRASIRMASTGELSVVSTTLTVPVEVTTGIRLAELLGLYGGAGVNFTTGSSTIEAVLDAELSIHSSPMPIGTAHITASGSSGPSAVTVHALAGAELHTPHVRAFLQGAIAADERMVALGVRAAF